MKNTQKDYWNYRKKLVQSSEKNAMPMYLRWIMIRPTFSLVPNWPVAHCGPSICAPHHATSNPLPSLAVRSHQLHSHWLSHPPALPPPLSYHQHCHVAVNRFLKKSPRIEKSWWESTWKLARVDGRGSSADVTTVATSLLRAARDVTAIVDCHWPSRVAPYDGVISRESRQRCQVFFSFSCCWVCLNNIQSWQIVNNKYSN